MLQFANQPDLAYDMCISIAPDCGSFGLQTSDLALDNTDYDEKDYDDRIEVTESLVHVESEGKPSDQFDQSLLIERQNQSENQWAVSSRDMPTLRPYWQVSESYAVTPPYPLVTDNGKRYP